MPTARANKQRREEAFLGAESQVETLTGMAPGAKPSASTPAAPAAGVSSRVRLRYRLPRVQLARRRCSSTRKPAHRSTKAHPELQWSCPTSRQRCACRRGQTHLDMAFICNIPLPRRARVIAPSVCSPPTKRPRTATRATYPTDSEPPANDRSEPFASDTPFTSNGTQAPAIDTTFTKVPLEELKLQFYSRACSVNRGFAASPSSKQQLLSLVEQIERENPTAEPTSSELLTGDWRLLYTNALDVLSLGLLSPLVLVAEVFQNVRRTDERSFSVVNVVNFEPSLAAVSNAFFGRTLASLFVSAAGTTRSDTRIDIVFKGVQVKPVSVCGFELPSMLSSPQIRVGSPTGYIETTFLDEDIRIARAPPTMSQSSNIFVLQRVES